MSAPEVVPADIAVEDNSPAEPGDEAPVKVKSPFADNKPKQSVPGQKEAPEQKAAPAPKPKHKVSYKIDDQEVEEEMDEDTMRELAIAQRRKDKAADKRFQEAATQRKQVEQALKHFKSDPRKALEGVGLNPLELAQKLILEQIEEESMSDEDKHMRSLEQELAKYKKEEEEISAREAAEREEQLVNMEKERLGKLINEALKTPNVPNGPWAVQRMAGLIAKNEQLGLDLSPSEIAEYVREEFDAEHRAMYAQMDAERLYNLFGPDVRNKIRQHELKMWRTPNKAQAFEEASNTPAPKPSGQGKDWLKKYHEQLLKGEK